jgi:hypothetical protein
MRHPKELFEAFSVKKNPGYSPGFSFITFILTDEAETAAPHFVS